MNNLVSITDFRNNIGTYIDQVIYNQENFILKKGNKAVARVSFYSEPKGRKDPPLTKLIGLLTDREADELTALLDRMNEESKNEIEKTIKLFKK